MGYFDHMKDMWDSLENRYRLWCGYGVIALLGLALAWSAFAANVEVLEKKRSTREAVLKDLLPLKAAFQSAKVASDQAAGRRAGLKPDDSPVKIVEETGIKGKGLKVSPSKGDDRPGFVEEAAEIKIEGLTSNELVNLLYRIEKGSRPLIIKKATVRGRFDNPAMLDLTMIAALVKPAASDQAKQ